MSDAIATSSTPSQHEGHWVCAQTPGAMRYEGPVTPLRAEDWAEINAAAARVADFERSLLAGLADRPLIVVDR